MLTTYFIFLSIHKLICKNELPIRHGKHRFKFTFLTHYYYLKTSFLFVCVFLHLASQFWLLLFLLVLATNLTTRVIYGKLLGSYYGEFL